MDNFKAIGQFIEQKRVEKGLSQTDLAARLNVSKSTISLYEGGSRKPSLARLTEISEILVTPLAHFLSLDSPDQDLDLALRGEGLTNNDVKAIRNYIKFVQDGQKAEEKEGKK